MSHNPLFKVRKRQLGDPEEHRRNEEVQRQIVEKFKSQPSRIVKERLENGTQYKLLMTPRYYSKIQDVLYKKDIHGIAHKEYLRIDESDYVVVDKGEDGSKNDIIFRENVEKMLLEHRFKYGNVKSTAEALVEPAYYLLHSGYFNSEKNPVYLTTLKYPFIDYLSLTEFDNGDIYINIRLRTVIAKTKKNNSLVINSPKLHKYCIKIKVDKPMSITKNGRLLYSDMDVEFFFIHCVLLPFYKNTEGLHDDLKWFGQKIDQYLLTDKLRREVNSGDILFAEGFVCYYKAMRHENLADLPWDIEKLSVLYQYQDNQTERDNARRAVNRYLRLGNTKKAVDACFYGVKFPKALRKFLIANTAPLQFPASSYKTIKKCCDTFGVNKTVDLLKAPNGTANIFAISRGYLFETLLLGFSYDDFKRHFEGDFATAMDYADMVLDTVQMYEELQEMGANIEINVKKISEFHDIITPIYTKLKKTAHTAEAVALKTVATDEDTTPFEYGEYIVREPHTAFELVTVGSNMHHCVASYAQEYFYKLLNISLVVRKDDDSYVACIEHTDGFVLQAKLHYNRQVKAKPEVLEVVTEWAKENNLKFATRDLLDKEEDWSKESKKFTSSPKVAKQRDKQRVELVEKLTKEFNDSILS